MAEVVLERRAALRSNGEKIREVVRLKELQHHFISYRSKVFWTKGITFCVVYFGKRNHFYFLGGVLDKRNHFHFLGGVKTRGTTFTFGVVYFGKRNYCHFLSGVLDKRNHFHFLVV